MSYSKYGAVKSERDGIIFASRKEARRYDELKLLAYAGAISELECQPRYELQPAFTRGRKKIPAVTYVGDFQYREDGRVVCEDVKGVETAVFKLKKRLFEFKFPDIELRIV